MTGHFTRQALHQRSNTGLGLGLAAAKDGILDLHRMDQGHATRLAEVGLRQQGLDQQNEQFNRQLDQQGSQFDKELGFRQEQHADNLTFDREKLAVDEVAQREATNALVKVAELNNQAAVTQEGRLDRESAFRIRQAQSKQMQDTYAQFKNSDHYRNLPPEQQRSSDMTFMVNALSGGHRADGKVEDIGALTQLSGTIEQPIVSAKILGAGSVRSKQGSPIVQATLESGEKVTIPLDYNNLSIQFNQRFGFSQGVTAMETAGRQFDQTQNQATGQAMTPAGQQASQRTLQLLGDANPALAEGLALMQQQAGATPDQITRSVDKGMRGDFTTNEDLKTQNTLENDGVKRQLSTEEAKLRRTQFLQQEQQRAKDTRAQNIQDRLATVINRDLIVGGKINESGEMFGLFNSGPYAQILDQAEDLPKEERTRFVSVALATEMEWHTKAMSNRLGLPENLGDWTLEDWKTGVAVLNQAWGQERNRDFNPFKDPDPQIGTKDLNRAMAKHLKDNR